MIESITILSLLFTSAFYWGQNFYGTRFAVFLILGAIWLGFIVARRVHWSAGLCFAWILISGAMVFGAPISPYKDAGDLAVMAFDTSAAIDTVSVLIMAGLLCSIGGQWRISRAIIDAMSALCMIDSLYVFGQWALGHESTNCGGLFVNASMNACLIAFTYPILKRARTKPPSGLAAIGGLISLIIPVMAILASRSNMALMALLGALAAPAAVRLWRGKHRLISPAVMASLLGAGYCCMGTKFGDNNGRFEIWRATLSWWMQHANHWTGAGLGSYFIIGPGIQIAILHQNTAHLLWMHNDWLQVLFEQGAIGLALAITVFGRALARSIKRDRPWLTSSLSAFGVTMLGNFPMHVPVMGFLGSFLLVFALMD